MRHSFVQEDLRRARQGDRHALDRVLDAIQGRLRALAERRLGPRLRARVRTSDVLQSTFLDVVRSLHRFDGDDMDQFVAWSSRIMENNIRDEDKYFQALKRNDATGAPLELTAANDLPASRGNPREEVPRGEDLLVVLGALEHLPRDYRRVILLRVGEGLSHREVATILGRSESAVRMLLSRARASLALTLETQDSFSDA
jgi:RNA polymerase sigma-70 factor (ECF subfamily)